MLRVENKNWLKRVRVIRPVYLFVVAELKVIIYDDYLLESQLLSYLLELKVEKDATTHRSSLCICVSILLFVRSSVVYICIEVTQIILCMRTVIRLFVWL